jgi:hypothetical protein
MASAIMTSTEDKKYEIWVGYMTSVPAIGHLEYTLFYNRDADPSRDDLLRVITPHVLEHYLGGTPEDWLIDSLPLNEDGQYVYTFDWKNLDNNGRMCPVMRTTTFRPHLHQATIVVPQ